MIRNILKKTAVSLFSIFATIILFSCTFIHENKSGRVSFSVSNIVQNSSRAAVTINSTDFLEVSLLGDYSETQTVSIKDASTIVFEEVPLEAQIYAEVYIYRINALNKRYNKYSGKSEPLIVQEGENLLTVKLSPITSGDNPEANEKTIYTVKHLLQNVEDDDYTEDDTLREILEGTASANTNAKAKSISGFTVQAFEQKTIQSDESTVVEIYYNRNVHTVKYLGGSDDVTDIPEVKQYRYGAIVSIEEAPTREGYDFTGWLRSDTDGNEIIYKTNEQIKIEDYDIILTATWKDPDAKEAGYKVIHYQQNIDDDEYTEIERENKTGIVGESTNAQTKSYNGFTVAAAISQEPIKEDGTTVIKIYYNRNTYTISYEGGDDSVTGVPTDNNQYRYGATINIKFTESMARTGYTFTYWKDINTGKHYTADSLTTLTVDTEDITLYAQWTPNTYNITYELNNGSWANDFTATTTYTYGERQNLPGADKVIRTGYGFTGWCTEDGTTVTEISVDMIGDIKLFAQWMAGATNYTVRHLQQNIDDNEYAVITDDEQHLAGISGELTNASANSYEGFTAKTITQQEIEADGSTVVDIYYDRKVHTVTYVDGKNEITPSNLIPSSVVEGSIPSQETLRYGATGNIQISVTPTLKGYIFAGWKKDDTIYTETSPLNFIMGDEDIVITAVWEPDPNTAYTVHHLKQNVDNDEYTLEDEITENGGTGDQTNAATKSYTGFTAVTPVTQEIISPDGDTIVEIKYNRNTYTVSYNANVLSGETISVPSDTSQYRYEAPVTVKFTGIGTRTGYTFIGWATSSSATTATYTSSDITTFNMGSSNIILYAIWQVENQNTGIDVDFGVDSSTIEVTQSGSNFTASTGYNSYSWTVDGTNQTNTTNVLDLSSITISGVYDITLTATKTVNGTTVTHTWTGQYIKS